MVAPKKVHILILGTGDRLPGERDFADGTKFGLLRWGNYPGLCRWARYNPKGPCNRETGGTERAGAMTEQRWEVMPGLQEATAQEDGRALETGKEQILP